MGRARSWQRAWRGARALASALLLAAMPGCFLGGQTGQEGSKAHEPEPCGRLMPQPIAPDETTALGISARELAATVEGTREQPFTWYRPQGSPTRVTVVVVPAPEQSAQAKSETCPGRVEMPAEVVLTTGDGWLAERFAGTIEANSLQDVAFVGSLPLAALQGQLDRGEFDDFDVLDPVLDLYLFIGEEGFSGRLSLSGRDPNPDDSSSPTSPLLAEF